MCVVDRSSKPDCCATTDGKVHPQSTRRVFQKTPAQGLRWEGRRCFASLGPSLGKLSRLPLRWPKGFFLAFKGRLEHKTLTNMLLMDGSLVLTCLCCRLLTRLASLGGRRPCAAWERWAAHRGKPLSYDFVLKFDFPRLEKPGSWRMHVLW